MKRIYVISKTIHAERWQFFRTRSVGLFDIISTWIDDGPESKVDFAEAWPRYLSQAAQADFALVYLEPGETLKGGMAELGAALSHGATACVVGDRSSLRTIARHPRVHFFTTVDYAVQHILEASGGLAGRIVDTYA